MDKKQALVRHIQQCAERNAANHSEDGSRYFDTPLVGFASAHDDLFERYKTIIGSFHWTPSEVLARAYGAGGPSAQTGDLLGSAYYGENKAEQSEGEQVSLQEVDPN